MTEEAVRDITRDEYAECLNQDFIVEFAPEYKVTMKLIEVSKEEERHRQKSFSLTFGAPTDTPIDQRIFGIQNEKLGKFELFLVPVGREDHVVLFQSVFNRLLPRQVEA